MATTAELDKRRWSEFVEQTLADRKLNSVSAARIVGPSVATDRTIRRWLNAEHGVAPDKVRDFCRALGVPVVHGLVRVGFLEPEDLGFLPTARRIADRLIRVLDETLADARIPERARRLLRAALQGTYDDWLSTQAGPAAPAEPSAKQRARGAVVRPTDGRNR